MVQPIEHTGEDHVRYQGATGTIDPDSITLQRLEDIWKQWGETWIWQNIEVISDGAWDAVGIRKGTLMMVCDGSFQPNLDENRGAAKWVIHCTDTYRYAWGFFPTTPNVENIY